MFARPATDPGQAYQRPPVTAAGISSPPQLTSPRVLQIPIYSWYGQNKMALYKRMCIYRGQIIGLCLWRGSQEETIWETLSAELLGGVSVVCYWWVRQQRLITGLKYPRRGGETRRPPVDMAGSSAVPAPQPVNMDRNLRVSNQFVS